MHWMSCSCQETHLSTEEENHEKKVENNLWWCIRNMIRKNVNMTSRIKIQMFSTSAQVSDADQVTQVLGDTGVLS